jgi:hypothetical protein
MLTVAALESRNAGAVPIRVGVNAGHWLIGADGQDGDGLRLIFTRYGRHWELDRDTPVQVIAGGEDKTAQAEGDIGKAMALAFGGDHPADGTAGQPEVRRQAGFRQAGVETRRMVVKRE